MAETCNDKKCPHHNSLSTRGRIFTGVVIAEKMQRTAIVEWERRKLIPKYERYEKKRTKIKAHNPLCISAKKGEIVEIMECKPISKTKHFVIIKKAGKERLFAERQEKLAEAKVKQTKKEDKKPEKSKENSDEVKDEGN